jgi:flagellar protein FlgJ
MAGSDSIIRATLPSSIDPSIKLRPGSANASKRDELKRACQDFEAIFTNQMFQEMRRTISNDGLFNGGRAEEIFTSMQDAELAKSMSRQKGLGLADVLYRQLSQVMAHEDAGETIEDFNDSKNGND